MFNRPGVPRLFSKQICHWLIDNFFYSWFVKVSPPFSLFWSFFVVSFWRCQICICFLFSTFSCLCFSFFLYCLILYLSSLSLPFLVSVLSKMSQKKNFFFLSSLCRIFFVFLSCDFLSLTMLTETKVTCLFLISCLSWTCLIC